MGTDAPCTGEPAKPAVVYIVTPSRLRAVEVLVIDFYAEV